MTAQPGVLIYKCRKCVVTFSAFHSQNVITALCHIKAGQAVPENFGPLQPEMLMVHRCDEPGYGIADLTGAKYDKEDGEQS